MPKPTHPRRRIAYSTGKIAAILTPRSRRAHCPETIVRAALAISEKSSSNVVFILSKSRPARHHHLILEAVTERGMSLIGSEQGFLTSTGRFVGREEAREIAFACGQVQKTVSRTLTSEDLW